MHSTNHWGGSFELDESDPVLEEERRRELEQWDRGALPLRRIDLDETQAGWLLDRQETWRKKKKNVNLGCIAVARKPFFLTVGLIAAISLAIILTKVLHKHKSVTLPPDNYSLALHKALLFFNAQKSGRLPKDNGIRWRGDSGLTDGKPVVPGGLVGGYYDGGTNIKFHFPMAFSMTMLSWSLLEYSHKFKAVGEYDHIRDLIKWGTDYILLTFNSSATQINQVYTQVGGGLNVSTTPDDLNCWQKPEFMTYKRPVLSTGSGPDLASEMAAALAAASIVFKDKPKYSKRLIKGAETLWQFANRTANATPYSRENAGMVDAFYNSTSVYDEYLWCGAWMYYATGNRKFLDFVTERGLPEKARAFSGRPDLYVPSWNNKLPGAMLLLTRYRLFLGPGYPYENMLRMYHNMTGLTMCSYLQRYHVFKWTKGGLVLLNMGKPQPLQYVAHASFLASLFADYLNATDTPGWYCGPTFLSTQVLKDFARSQIDYILGKNPLNMSYMVGFGTKFPRRVNHRGASIPNDHKKRSCTDGRKWRDTSNSNPNNVTGAMVGGPNQFDQFHDLRNNVNASEPTLAANAGLVAALVSLTATADGGIGIDMNTIFSGVPPLYRDTPPPPAPWRP